MLRKTLFAVLLAAFAATGLAQVDPNRVVAVVNGQEIKGSEYYRRMEFLPGVGKSIGPNRFAQFPPGFMTLEQLITERLVLQLAREKGVLATDGELDQEMRRRLEEDPKFIDNWLATGQSREELEQQVRLELNQFKIVTAGINVTDAEVEDFYRKNPEIFTIPRRVTLRVIVVGDTAVRDAVDADLKGGKTFADVARARSLDVTKETGGEYGTIPVTALNQNVRTALSNVKVGETTAWLQTGDAQVKFLLEAAIPEQKQELTPALRRQWRRQLMVDRGRVRNDIQKEMAALRAKSTIEIKEKSFADAYKRFIDAYLQEARGRSGN